MRGVAQHFGVSFWSVFGGKLSDFFFWGGGGLGWWLSLFSVFVWGVDKKEGVTHESVLLDVSSIFVNGLAERMINCPQLRC